MNSEEIPSENVKRLYKVRKDLGRPVDDYLKRFPSLEKKEEVVKKPGTINQEVVKKEVKKSGKK